MAADEPHSLQAREARDSGYAQRVLLLPPTQRDGAAIASLLTSASIGHVVFSTMSALCAAIDEGAGAVIVSEESLAEGTNALALSIAKQPVWSDLPVLILSKAGVESQRLAASVVKLGNVSVVERPVRISTMLSLVRSALRARGRQYQVRTHVSDLESARSEAERVGRIKDEFLATLSHELRTPLNAIVGWSQIIRSAPERTEDVAEGIQVIERNARAQTQIIEDLLDMSRIINGRLRLDVQRVDLAKVIQAASDTVAPAAEAKGIRLLLVLDPMATSVSGDPNRLQQVFWNLLSNGIKFTPRGGRVQVLLERINSHLEVSIIDTGEGIETEFLPLVFDRFRQADATTTRRHGGLGLGLAIVKQLIELHGGTIQAKSPGRGKGATFVVSLPLTVLHPEPDPLPPRHHPAAPAVPMTMDTCAKIEGVRILVVDDEADARELLRRLLLQCKAIVGVAATADEALSLLQSERPDVLISDIGMPGTDGYALIQQVRALNESSGGQTPAIALTAYARSEDRVKAMVSGFQQHLSKPVEPAELIAVVATLVNGRASANAT